MKLKIYDWGRFLFNCVLSVLLLGFVFGSFKHSPEVRLVPLLISIPTLIAVIIILIGESKKKLGLEDEPKEQLSVANGQETLSRDKNERKRWWDVLRIGIYLFIFLIGIFFVGFIVMMPAFIFTFLFVEGGVKWHRSLFFAFFASITIYVMFRIVLKLELWSGILREIIPGILGGSILPPI